jgi:hypothetical protein
MSGQRSTVVLVHGGWHGSWCWAQVVPLLERRGISVRTVDLPSIGADPDDPSALSGDAAVVVAGSTTFERRRCSAGTRTAAW